MIPEAWIPQFNISIGGKERQKQGGMATYDATVDYNFETTQEKQEFDIKLFFMNFSVFKYL